VKSLSWFRFVWTGFVVAATSAPYLWNWLSTPPGFHYTWILPPYLDDSFGYAAWAQQAAHGAWLFKFKYTSLPHSAFFFHPFFLICGWMSALFSCDGKRHSIYFRRQHIEAIFGKISVRLGIFANNSVIIYCGPRIYKSNKEVLGRSKGRTWRKN
jgi:hypothetical protein